MKTAGRDSELHSAGKLQRMLRFTPRPLRRHKVVEKLLAALPSFRTQEIEFNGDARLVADISDPDVCDYFLKGLFEPDFFAIGKPFAAAGGVVFDVGANFGFCSFGLYAALRDREIDFHLFEANPNLCDFLEASGALNPGMALTISQCCVGDFPGHSRLSIDGPHLGQSFISKRGEVKVENLLLDDYIRAKRIKEIAFLKMDIEGYEVFALRGAKEALSTGTIKAAYIEVSSVNLAKHGLDTRAPLSLLRDAGFRLFFCKEADLRSEVRRKRLTVNGCHLVLAEIDGRAFSATYQSDILAIHSTSKFLCSIAETNTEVKASLGCAFSN